MERTSLRVVVVALAVTAFGTGVARQPSSAERMAMPALSLTADVLWDTWGIPHIFASDAEGLFFAFGWAQMAAHGDLVLRLYGEARGRAAEYWGAESLDSDTWVRTVGIPAEARRWYDAQSSSFRPCIDRFVEGMNAYARAHGGRIDPAVARVLPVVPTDVMAHALRVLHYTFVTSREDIDDSAKPWREKGSNAWAIGPSRSASGHAMLLANPHLPWSGFFTWFEAQLVAPGVDASGAALVGMPMLGIAFNDALGWTHTVNTIDAADLYELIVEGDSYRWNGRLRSLDIVHETLRVRQPDGTLRDEPLVIKRSVHGPVVSERAGKALALRVAGVGEAALAEQYWDMIRARNLREFESAIARLQMPMFTVMYADRDGNILHVFGGRTPVRTLASLDWRSIVPGDSDETLWTRTHAYGDLPRVLNPPSHWLQNANDPPWTTTFPAPLRPDDFPSYMSPRAMSFRAQRSARLLDEDAAISFEEMVAYKHSTRMELADRLLDDLLPAARAGSESARRAADVLDAWDRSADAGSRGAVLFREFLTELSQRSRPAPPFATPWREGAPRTTPDGLASASAAVAALEGASTRVASTYGSLDVPWGEVNRLRRDTLDLAGNGGSGGLGIFRVVAFERGDDGRAAAIGGDSWVGAIEFSTPVRAMALLGYGNASQRGSPHRTDQLPLVAGKRLRSVWRSRSDVEANLERREVVSPRVPGRPSR